MTADARRNCRYLIRDITECKPGTSSAWTRKIFVTGHGEKPPRRRPSAPISCTDALFRPLCTAHWHFLPWSPPLRIDNGVLRNATACPSAEDSACLVTTFTSSDARMNVRIPNSLCSPWNTDLVGRNSRSSSPFPTLAVHCRDIATVFRVLTSSYIS